MLQNTLIKRKESSQEPWDQHLEAKIESINIGLTSPLRIRAWTSRKLPNGKKIGEVLNSKTVNYKTLKPEIGGLFCEKIFGPIKDFECSCGTKKIEFKGKSKFCPDCDIEFTASRVRRYRLGFIKLASPVTHIWYLKGRPRFLNILFDMAIALNKGRTKDLKPVVYGVDGIYIPIYTLTKTNKKISHLIKKTLYPEHTEFFPTARKGFFPTENLLKTNTEEKKLNSKIDNFNNLQLVINKIYFKKKLQNTFFKSLNIENVLFNKQLTKIIQNSYYSDYNNACLYTTTLNQQPMFSTSIASESNSLIQHPKKPFRATSLKIFLNKKITKIILNPSFQDKLLVGAQPNSKTVQRKQFKKKSEVTMQSVQLSENQEFLRENELKFKESDIIYSTAKILNKVGSNLNLMSFNQSETSFKKCFFKQNKHQTLLETENRNPELQIHYKTLNKKGRHFKKTLAASVFTGGRKTLPVKKPVKTGFLNFVENPFFPTERIVSNVKSQINSYYPLYSRCIFKFIDYEDENNLEFKYLWSCFINYMSFCSTKQDTILLKYSNRLGNAPVVIDNFEYKYKKILLTGTEAVSYWLKNLNLLVLETQLKKKIPHLDDKIKKFRGRPFLYKFQKKTLKKIIKIRRKVFRLIKLVYYLKKNKLRPDWLMISILPVLPPNLRPIIQLDANQIAVSDLNQLYKRVIYRNKRIEKYINRNRQTDSNEIRFHQRLLQEAVDALIDNGKGGSQLACSGNGRPFKSLSEILKGKKGRFRQNLLGKRVDYSGRSVIIVGPELKLHECGLPKEMAIELFQPFITRDLLNLSEKKIIDKKITIVKAKKLIKSQHPIVWEILKKILKNHPILLNRAPTLHRLGIQAFQPKLVEGRAILLHPLVCPAFNADFDGDQMAVHVPLCFQARAEAWKLMWSRNNLLSPATGEPIIIPSQDMILGCYYLTTTSGNIRKQILNVLNLKQDSDSNAIKALEKLNTKVISGSFNLIKENQIILEKKLQGNSFTDSVLLNKYFSNLDQVLIDFSQKKISLHSLIWVKWQNLVEIENFYEKPLELRIDCYGNVTKIYSKYFQNLDSENIKISQFILTTIGRVILNKIILENIKFN